MREGKLSGQLLEWYDANAREMPWRVGPAARATGVMPDPYAIWMSEVMLQQTTVAAVRGYFARFIARWPDVRALAGADDGDVMGEWAGLGYYARARNLLKCARVVAAEHGGQFPDSYEALLKLPGIGPYTAAAIASIAFDRAETVVDGNVERVMARLFAVRTPLPTAKPELTALAAKLTPLKRPGDYAQAVMDLGATVCTPRNPSCDICPLSAPCKARAQGIAADLPAKLPKKPKPVRHGTAWLAQRNDEWLLERRPEKGLLGGMLGWPGVEWAEDEKADPGPPPFEACWENLGQVRHTFTHFHLFLTVMHTADQRNTTPQSGTFQPLDPSDLPTVMRKAFDLAYAHTAKD